jgi:type II secretory pathway pseudopilin PulG
MGNRKGYTLFEVTVALGIWLILSAGVLSVWRYAANASGNIIQRQDAFENARGAMDIMLMHIQLAGEVYIYTHNPTINGVTHENVLRRLCLPVTPLVHEDEVRLNPPPRFTFLFDITLPQTHERHSRLELSGHGNEVARRLAYIRVDYTLDQRINIKIRTTCKVPIVLEGSVCVKYKRVTLLT